MVSQQKGKLVVIEALDGAGKSTQIELLREKYSDPIMLKIFRYPTNKTPKIRQFCLNSLPYSPYGFFHLLSM